MALDPEARAKLRRLVDRHKVERTELVDALQLAVDENDDLKKKTADGDKLKLAHDELKVKVKAGEYRAAFNKAAKAAGVADEHMDDAWDLAKVDTKGDAPDDKAIGASIAKLVEKRTWLKAAAADEDLDQGDDKDKEKPAGETTPPTKLEKGEGSARGGAGKGPAGKYVMNRADLNNFDFMRANGAEFSRQSAAGNVHFIGNAQ